VPKFARSLHQNIDMGGALFEAREKDCVLASIGCRFLSSFRFSKDTMTDMVNILLDAVVCG
jgi:hypothetical protein